MTGVLRHYPPTPPPPIRPKAGLSMEDRNFMPMIRPKIEELDPSPPPPDIDPKIEDHSPPMLSPITPPTEDEIEVKTEGEIEIPAAKFPPTQVWLAAKSGQPMMRGTVIAAKQVPAKPRPMQPPPGAPLMQPPMMKGIIGGPMLPPFAAPPPMVMPKIEPPGPMEQARIARFLQNRDPTYETPQQIAYQNLPKRAEPWKLSFVPKAPGRLGLQGPTRAWATMGVSWAYRVSQGTPFMHHVWVETPAVVLRGSPRPGLGLLQPAPR